jgi:hypothetical protein
VNDCLRVGNFVKNPVFVDCLRVENFVKNPVFVDCLRVENFVKNPVFVGCSYFVEEKFADIQNMNLEMD